MPNSFTPRESLNKALLKVKLEQKVITNFKINLTNLLNQINDEETEEFHKNIVSEFLRSTYYGQNHYINTKGRNDLVIHNGTNANSTVGVIIEAKKTTNKSEMPTTKELNAKALHELVLYYLRERITENNLELKHLIATNTQEWFIFDARIFEKEFAENKELVRKFIDFEQDRLSGKKTELFYKEIAKPAIETIKKRLNFTHFDIRNFEKVIRSKIPRDDRNLIALFKIFSPEHLLKLPFTNDSNTLDKAFYSELLHILGLTEVKKGGKKLIERKKIGMRDSGSLIENAINKIDNSDKIQRLSNQSHFGDTHDDRIFNVGLELIITWINRILFLKLLESQLLKYHSNDVNYSFLNFEKIKDYDELNSLFFSVLAKLPKLRNEDVSQKFAKVPYLNSSLFEPTEIEHQTIEISNLGNDKNLSIFTSTVLRNYAGKKRKGELNTLKYLFEFLEAYDFSSEGFEEIQVGSRALINASVLGLIFEKINGYKEGSYFTPGFITMYMCRETIQRAIIQKFNDVEGWNCISINDLYEKIGSNKQKANDIINGVKICDPAVGSGHFLVSALNEIITIKSELKILLDRNGKTLRDYDVHVENDELVILDDDGQFFEYNPKNKEKRRVQEALFHEKLTIIENCLFGVDINPNSVKICQLRLWIELLKNAYYKSPNLSELETLPNIDINIKCGNSLISRFPLDSDIRKALKKIKWTIGDYRNAVMTYRNTQNKDKKREMERLISDIKNEFRDEVSFQDPLRIKLNRERSKLEKLLTQLDFFVLTKARQKAIKLDKEKLERSIIQKTDEIEAIESNKIYEKAFEWRFEFPEVLNDYGEFVGFDVVIGNPPYIYNRDLVDVQRDYFKEKYLSADDMYVYFARMGVKLLNNSGLISLITPNTYFTLSTRSLFRKLILDFSNLKFTYSGYCFEDAYVETMILSLSRNKSDIDKVTFVSNPRDYVTYENDCAKKKTYLENHINRLFVPTEYNMSIYNQIHYPLKGVTEKYKNVLLGKKDIDNTLTDYVKNLKVGDLTLLGLVSEGEQGLVTGNNSKYIGVVIGTKEQKHSVETKFVDILNNYSKTKITIEKLNKDLNSFYKKAEKIKSEIGINVFGKFSLYKCIELKSIKEFTELTKNERDSGGESDLWVYYNRGNSEGFKWFVPNLECINWSRENVNELKEGTLTNSRWQGSKFYNKSGFGWVDYFTDSIKAFFVNIGVYSKNVVKLHCTCSQLSDKYIVALLNSSFISYYAKNFITSTHTLQINDGRLIPIVIPSKKNRVKLESLVDQILDAKQTELDSDISSIEKKINQLVYKLYNLTSKEIAIVEGQSSSK